MKEKLKVAWFSAGISSFIATKLAKNVDKIIYEHIDDQHEDSLRFVKDCEKFLGKEIEIIQSPYKNVENAILSHGVIRLVSGFAPCTKLLKRRVREEWEYKHSDYDITYVWGFDIEEQDRAKRLVENEPNFKHEFPLIEHKLSKKDCHALSEKLGIKRPKMYDLGYPNNNCIGCVKGGMGYWNMIRKDFPKVFENRAKLERKIGYSCLKQCFLDELDPNRGDFNIEVFPSCSMFCMLVEEE